MASPWSPVLLRYWPLAWPHGQPPRRWRSRIRTLAEADALRTRLQAEATGTGQGIARQHMLVEKTVEIIGAAASQLAYANITVLN